MATDPVMGNVILAEGTAQGELVVNEWFARLHATMIRVVSKGLNTPPGSPVNFDAYIVGASPTGDWSGQGGKIAFYVDGWKFITPKEGMRVRDMGADLTLVYSGSAWQAMDGFQTLTDGANIDWDTSLGLMGVVTLGGNRIMNAPTNMPLGSMLRLKVTQDGTGSRTLTWNAAFKWAGGTPPTLSAGAGESDLLIFVVTGASELYGWLAVADAS